MRLETVHPHGCGERLVMRVVSQPSFGSSPRLWGTLSASPTQCSTGRFIPTAVGNACQGLTIEVCGAVHPHGCGERVFMRTGGRSGVGSSPRLWGTRFSGCRTPAPDRFIPTAVGNAQCKGW